LRADAVAGYRRHTDPTMGTDSRSPAIRYAIVASCKRDTHGALRESVATPSPKPKLLDRVRQALCARHYSRRTKRHPAEMGATEITAFLTSLAVRDHVAASTQNQALNALLFLYRHILGVELPWLDDLVRAKRPEHLPAVLTRDETQALIDALDGVSRSMWKIRARSPGS
jgi:integrase